MGADCADEHVLAVSFLHTSHRVASETKQSTLIAYYFVYITTFCSNAFRIKPKMILDYLNDAPHQVFYCFLSSNTPLRPDIYVFYTEKWSS